MAQVDIATVDAMLIAIDNALEDIVPTGGIADAAALGTLTGRVSDAETALEERALVTALTAESQARTDADTAINTALATKVATAELGVGVATLENGKIPASQLPALAVTDTFVVGTQAEQTALVAQRGDIVVRTDFAPHRNYILVTDDPTNFNNWRQLTSPGAVTSVDGLTGAVTLGSTSTVANTLARRKPTGALSIAAAQVDGEAVELAQLNAALLARDGRLTALEGADVTLSGRVSVVEAVRLAQVHARVNTTRQSIASSSGLPVALTFEAASGPTPSMWSSTSPTRLAVPSAGVYSLSIHAPWPPNATGTRGLAYRINGGTWVYSDNKAPASASYGSEHSVTVTGVDLAINDYVEAGAWQDSGVALLLTANAGGFARAGLIRTA